MMKRYRWIGLFCGVMTVLGAALWIGAAEAGNITAEIPSGMFLNPTAEVQPAGTSVIESCWANQKAKAGTYNGVNAFGSYTFPTKTEVGVILVFVDPPAGDQKTAPGAFVRQLLRGEEGLYPAVAVGATYFEESDDVLTRRSVFASVSKTVTPKGAAMPVRLHVGGKWIQTPSNEDKTVYGGAEIDLTKDFSLIGETEAKDEFDTKMPYAVGVQYRYKGRLGLSLAAMNGGNAGHAGVFFGVGYPFTGY
jgi:hypothetical protein